MKLSKSTIFRKSKGIELKHYRFNFNDFRLRKTLKLNIAKSYVTNNYVYFDSIEKTLAFLESATPIDNRTLDSIYYDMVLKLSKKLVRKTSNITFKRKIDWNTYKTLINDNNAIVIEKPFNSGNFYRLLQPSYALACLDIVNHHFNDSVFEDITQEIAQDLWKMYLNNQCKVVYNFITKDSEPIFVFDTYITKEGSEKSYYWKLFSTIERVLTNYSNHSKAQKKGYAITNIDSYEKAINPFLQNDDSKLTTQNINAYMHAINKYNKFNNDTVLKRNDIQEFFKKCENDFSRKHIDKLKFVLDCTFNGMTIKQTHICAKQNDISLSESAIGKIRLELRDLWAKYNMKVDIFNYDTDNFITYYKPLACYGKCESNNYIVESLNDSYTKISEKPINPYIPHDSIINMNLDTLATKDSNKCLALKKALKNNKLVNQNSDYAQWAISYGEKCLQYKESFYYMLDSQNWLDSYLSDIRTTNNYSVKCVKTQKGIDTYYNNQFVRHTNYITK